MIPAQGGHGQWGCLCVQALAKEVGEGTTGEVRTGVVTNSRGGQRSFAPHRLSAVPEAKSSGLISLVPRGMQTALDSGGLGDPHRCLQAKRQALA